MALGEFELLGERPAGSLIDLFQCSRPMHKSKIGGEGRYDHHETGKVMATLTVTAHERDHLNDHIFSLFRLSYSLAF
jgi:hypothetical protein